MHEHQTDGLSRPQKAERGHVLINHPGVVGLCVMIATALPLLLLLHRMPLFGSLSMFANDTFYYLTIAREAFWTGWPSFDGVYRTNGFHPVWEFVLLALTRIDWLKAGDAELTIVRTAYLNLVLLTLASGLVAWALCRVVERGWLVLLGLCPGLLWFFQAMVNARWAAAWSNLNGMESSTELLFFGAALAFCPMPLLGNTPQSLRGRGTNLRWLFTTFSFSMMVLSRLDDIFFLLPLGALFWSVKCTTDRWVRFTCFLIPLVLIGSYLAYNLSTVGVLIPSSGVAKTGFALWSNLRATWLVVKPNLSGAPARSGGAPFNVFSETYGRVFGMLAPAIACGLLIRWLRPKHSLIEALCFGVFMKSAYNFLLVSLFYQGSWYYGVNIFIANVCLVLATERLLAGSGRSFLASSTHGYGALLASGMLTALSSNAFLNGILTANAASGQIALLRDRQEIREMLSHAGTDRFVEFDDGMLTFSSGAHAIAGLGLALDPEANLARQRGDLLRLAQMRGYKVALATQPYTAAINLAMERVAGGGHDAQFGMRTEEFNRYRLILERTTGDGLVTMYRIEQRD